METPTGILSDEHQHILAVTYALLKECDAIAYEKRKPDGAFFRKAIDFIRNYADKFHHAKEEGILFKEMCSDSVKMHCNPTKQMLHEHELGRNFVKQLEESLKKKDVLKAVENARAYAELLQQHIYKEDNILYPMADGALSSETQGEMLKKFRLAENKKFNSGAKEKYLSIAREFEERLKAQR